MPARVLVVEDSPAVRGLIAVILQRAGYQVIPVSDASSALDAVSDLANSDLVICDVHLQGQSGIGLCDRLREKLPGLKILYMSGENIHATLPDDSAFMLKPFRPEVLVAKVKEMTG